MNKPHVLAHIKALLSSERFEMETMAVKLQAVLLLVPDGEDIHQRLGGIDRHGPERCRRDRHTETVCIVPVSYTHL